MLGFNPSNAAHAAWLRQLKPSPALALWEAGYDRDGHWVPQRVKDAAAAMVEALKR